jgi:hypothetical protein
MTRLALVALVALGPHVSPAAALTNILANPSFEVADPAGLPAGWAAHVHTADGAQGAIALDPAAHSGPQALRLDHTSANSAWVRAWQEPIPVRPDATYQLDFWVRATGPYRVVAHETRQVGLPLRTVVLAQGASGPAWQSFTSTFQTSPEAVSLRLSLIADGLGSVWFDDVSLAPIADRPAIIAPLAASPPSLTPGPPGPDWNDAAAVGGALYRLGASGQLAPVQTSARLLHDDDHLYLTVECLEPNPAGLVRRTTTPGPGVWADDCVEIFLAPTDPSAGLIHLGISAGGGTWQERVGGRQWYSDWFSWAAGPAALPPWQASVAVGPDRWWATASVPLAALGGTATPGLSSGLQLCRTRRAGGVTEYSALAYTEGDRYARPERFATLAVDPRPPVAPLPVARALDVERYAPTLVPQPTQVEWRDAAFRLGATTSIRISDASQTPPARLLQEDLSTRFGLQVPLVVSPDPPAGAGVIDLDAPASDSALLGSEAYLLTVRPEGIQLSAQDPRGRQWGVETLRQMLVRDATGPACRCVSIADRPALALRGWHVQTPLAAGLPLYRRLLDTMALLKLNTLVLQVDDRMQYVSHPDISRPEASTAAQLHDLVQYARDLQIEVIPQLSTFSHFNYVLRVPAYAALAESPASTLGRHDRWNYCPCNPDVYPLVYDLMEEVLQAFEPRVFHIGHDEVSGDDLAVCPRCRGQRPADLWAGDITKLADWLRQRGVQTAMWADTLLQDQTGGKPYDTYLALNALPRDIILYDWHYEPTAPFARTLGGFRQAGFQVVGCPWYEPENIYGCASAAAQTGARGTCGTTWADVPSALTRWPHLPTAMVVSAGNSWSPGNPALPAVPYAPVPVFNRLWRMAEGDPPARFLALDLSPYCNASLVDTERRDGWMGEGPDYDLRQVPAGLLWVGDVPFRLTDPAANAGKACLMLAAGDTPAGRYPTVLRSIRVGLRTPALYFLHVSGVPGRRDRRLYADSNPGLLGYYTVRYADGQTDRVPLTYQATIHDWNGQRGPAQAVGVWEAHTRAGALVSLAAVEWRNPRPQVSIQSLDFTSTLSDARPVLLGLTAEDPGDPPVQPQPN